MGATWVATPNTRQHDAYYQRQHVESLTRSGTSPNTLKQCQTGWQWFGRVGATLVRGWAMVGPPYWPHWILVGKIQCGSLTFRWRITRRDFSPAGPGPEVLTRPGTLCRERAVASPRAKHETLRRIRHVHSFFTSLTLDRTELPNGLPSAWRRCPPTEGIRAGGRRRRQLAGLAAEGQADMSKWTVVRRCYHPWLEVARWARNQLRVS